MARGLSSAIKTELGKTNLTLPVYCVRITLSPTNKLRYADRQVSFDDGVGDGVVTYSARLQSISGLDFSADQAGPIQIQFANADGAITTLDQQESFSGAACDVLAYLPGIATYYALWPGGWCDEFSQIAPDSATISAYPVIATPNVQIPKTVLGIQCGNTFGNFANWVNSLDFDGSGCPYRRVSTIGFAANLIGALDNSTDPISFSVAWGATQSAAGATSKVGEYLSISTEVMLITAAGANDGSFHQALTCARAQKGTTKITHADNDVVKFQDCTYSQDGCTRRGMYGNNASDSYTPPGGGSAKRNYYEGFPYLIGFQYGHYRTKAGEKPHPLRVVFSGNDGAYGRALPIGYGRHRVADPVLMMAKPEGDFLTTLWAVEEGVIATNAADDSQSGSGYTRNYAYSATITAPHGYRLENIYVNGESRHDTTPGFGIEVVNGDQDEAQPSSAFFPTDPADFINNNFGYWGTARVTLRVSMKSNPTVDVMGQQITGSMEVQYGKVHRVYLQPPGVPVLTPSASGGSLTSATYYYVITAIGYAGETIAGVEANCAVTGPSGKVVLTWTAIQGAVSYRIYRGTATGAENTYYSSGSASFTDTGAAGTAGSPPASPSAYVRRATDDGLAAGANPAFVILDLLAAKRAGAGLDYSRLNLQSFLDAAAYCSTLVTDTFFGGNVKRWTFNGVIDQRKSFQEWMSVLCKSFYCLPPYLDGNGKIKIRMLKAESLGGVPLFSSKVANASTRNILWDGPRSSLVKSRKSITELPNEVRANFVDKSHDPGFSALLQNTIGSTVDPISPTIQWSPAAIAAGIQFRKDDKIVIDSEYMWITLDPGPPDGSRKQVIHCQRAYNNSTKAAHAVNAIVQFWDSAYGKITITVADRDAQAQFGKALGDQTLRAVTKVVDLPGVTTYDEAARIATLILRAGDYADGGQSNNLQIQFKAYHRDACDLEVGDIIQLDDDSLDPVEEEYFRVNKISLPQTQLSDGGVEFFRQITATLHSNSIYDDTALTVPGSYRVESHNANDVDPDPVTNLAISENGVWDASNKPMTSLGINYSEPSPKGNYRSLLIFACTDSSGTQVSDWQLVGEVTTSGQALNYPVTGDFRWFAAVSRPLSGHTPDIDTTIDDGSYKYPRLRVFVDGITDTLPAPSSPSIAIGSDLVTLKWQPYSGDNLKLFKHFHIYRNTINDFSSATLIGSEDGTLFIDTLLNPSTVYYYWIAGLSLLNLEGTPTSALSTTSPANSGTDSAVPDAPTVGTILNLGSYNTNEYSWVVTIDPGTNNHNSVDSTTLQITTDPAFVAFPAGTSMNRTYAGKPTKDIPFTVNTPGVYYMRAKTHNAFGDSAWSGTITRNTSAFDNLSADSGIPPAPDNLIIATAFGSSQLSGNEFNLAWAIPSTNTASYYGVSIYIHNSSTLPTATTYYSSFAHGGVTATLTPGSNVLQIAGSPGFTVNDFQNKDIVVFATSRGGSPTFDYEGQMFVLNCTSNTANTITLNIAAERMIWNLSGLNFYVVTPGGGNHFFEKLKFSTPLEINQGVLSLTQDRSSRTRTAQFTSSIPTLFVWVALYNLYGQGKVTASPPSATFQGITTSEVFGASAGAGAVTEVKTNFAALGNLTSSLGTVQTGLLRTASSGARVEIDGTNGIRLFNSGGTVLAQMPLDSSRLRASAVSPLGTASTDSINIFSGDLAGVMFMKAASFNVTTAAGNLMHFSDTFPGLDINGVGIADMSGNHIGNGASLTSLNASNVSSGTLSNSRLTANVVLNNASFNISGTYDFNAGGGKVIERAFSSLANFKSGVLAHEIASYAESGVLYIGTFDGATYWSAACTAR